MTYDEAIVQHSLLHTAGAFAGFSLAAHIPSISSLIKDTNIRTVCDYGCGKAHGWLKGRYDLILGLNMKNIYLYDPCVEQFKKYPENKVDLVICTDVLEHIPEEAIDHELEKIFLLAKKAVYLSISYRHASKKLPNGENAHLTVQPESWWANKIRMYGDSKIIKGINLD